MLKILQDLIDWLKGQQAAEEEAEPPEDPYAYRSAPLRHDPKGRSGAAAVAEPEEEEEE